MSRSPASAEDSADGAGARAASGSGAIRGVDAERLRIRRFDADRNDQVLSLDEALAALPTERQLLWIDIVGELDEREAASVVDAFGLQAWARRELDVPLERPHLALHGDFVHAVLAVDPDAQQPRRAAWLGVIAGRNIVISHHVATIGFLDALAERVHDDTRLGMLNAITFVASLLDGAVTTYFRAIDAIEDDVDALDARSLRARGDVLGELVALRRRIARLRRLLATHRELFSLLARPDVTTLAGDEASAAALVAVSSRFENAIGAVEDSRDLLLGSFDVYMTRTAQRTNDIMKVLALATVVLLPGSLLAGLLGMNVSVPISKDDPISFWLVVGVIAAFSGLILAAARARRWL
ncbi:MAG TPA: magnesium transporter CorA family protein [Candidatus Limnocylindrales bacterium]|nr:magnesium transporter CorA family protein [Candidatus Limnocylindrales bacterium]